MFRSASSNPSARPSQPSSFSAALLLRALRHRNYRLFFAGQSISLIGSWLTRIATSWLVYRLTGSALLLGLVSFAGQIPMLIISPFAGVLVDRWNRHRILVVTQVLAMFQALALAGLTLSHVITETHIILLSILQGLINAFDMPARQAFLIEMIEGPEDLANGIALNSSMVNSARLLGPAIAGVLIASFGEGLCYLIDGLSYIAVVAALLMMRLSPSAPRAGPRKSAWHELHEGIRYVAGFGPIRAILLLLCVVSLMGMSYTVLMPVFATEVFKGGPTTLGFLMAASGVGALAGALYLASRRTVLGLGRVIVLAAAAFGLSLILFALSRTLWLAVPVMFITGFAMIVHMASSNTVLQTIVDEDKRGRVMSFYAVAFMGFAPIGSLLAGALARWIGPSLTVSLTGASCALAAALFAFKLPALRLLVRPIYRQKGIMPAVAEGLQSASDLKVPPES